MAITRNNRLFCITSIHCLYTLFIPTNRDTTTKDWKAVASICSNTGGKRTEVSNSHYTELAWTFTLSKRCIIIASQLHIILLLCLHQYYGIYEDRESSASCGIQVNQGNVTFASLGIQVITTHNTIKLLGCTSYVYIHFLTNKYFRNTS